MSTAPTMVRARALKFLELSNSLQTAGEGLCSFTYSLCLSPGQFDSLSLGVLTEEIPLKGLLC